MIAGMVPIALSIGEGTESLSPMAVAVIGGLITSTLLTLVVIPAAYTVIDDVQGFFRRFVRFGRTSDAEGEPGSAGALSIGRQS
ncbi:Cation efflux system protein CusA [compost metagenome]